MENISPGKERKNPLTAFLLLGVFAAVVLLLPPLREVIYKDDLTADVSKNGIAPKEIILLFTGDIMLSRAVGDIMERTGNWDYPFLNIAEFLSSADITFGNLEGPISAGGVKVGSIYSFRADPRVIQGLKSAGFDVLSIANNHIFDYGSDALIDTIQILEGSGIEPVGGGLNYRLAHEPVIKTADGVKVAYLAYTSLIPAALGSKEAVPAIAFLDLETAVSDVRAAKVLSDIVIVSVHWGDEYQKFSNEKEQEIGRALIDSGASLVVGHHPHVVQEIEKYNGGFIAYSLGNFVFDQNFSKETMESIILKATVRKNKIAEVVPIKIKINSSFQPYLDRTYLNNNPLLR